MALYYATNRMEIGSASETNKLLVLPRLK